MELRGLILIPGLYGFGQTIQHGTAPSVPTTLPRVLIIDPYQPCASSDSETRVWAYLDLTDATVSVFSATLCYSWDYVRWLQVLTSWRFDLDDRLCYRTTGIRAAVQGRFAVGGVYAVHADEYGM